MTGEDYLRRVELALRDLPWGMRRDLMSELRNHLAEGPAAAPAGTPEEYAEDLRTAAGLERRRGVIAFLRARRPRTLVASAVMLTVIGLAIGAAVWIQSYQPITFAGGTYSPAGVKGSPGTEDEYVAYRAGRPFRFGIVLENTGRFTVRVLGAPYPALFPFTARLLMSTPGPPSQVHVFPGPLQPFHPFDLHPGELSSLILEGVYACHTGEGPGNSWPLGPFPVRYSFLWHTATTWIQLSSQLSITLPKGCDIPGGTP